MDHELKVAVFVASPSDVAEERAMLEDIVSELNLTWSKTLKVALELIRWETHVTPGVGAYPQEVINRQIAEYDIFIGLLWARFGTATPGFGSGTEEEFNIALNGYRSAGLPSDIMIYFKETPINPSSLSPEQLSKLLTFKQSLGDQGALYWNFSGRDEFEQLLRLHLSRVAQRFADSAAGKLTIAPVEIEQPHDSEEMGFLDYLELGLHAFEVCNASLARMTGAKVDVGEAMARRTTEVESLYGPKREYDIHQMKKTAAGTAQDIAEFAMRIQSEVPIFRESYGAALAHICAAATLSVQDFNPSKESLTPLKTAIWEHQNMIPSVIEQIAAMKASVVRLPRVTVTLNKAKKAAINSLEQELEALDFARKGSIETSRLLDELISKLSQ